MDHCEAVKCYYASQQELEYAMQSLVQQLEDAGIADDTVIVIATDHYPYGLSLDEQSELAGHELDPHFEISTT